MSGIKETGFNLMDGSDWEGLFSLVAGEKIDKSRLSIHFQSPYCEERIETVTQNLLKRMEYPAE